MTFLTSETGAVTVDWVVLTAGLVGLGLATMAVVSSGAKDLSTDIDQELSTSIIRTGFAPDAGTLENLLAKGGKQMKSASRKLIVAATLATDPTADEATVSADAAQYLEAIEDADPATFMQMYADTGLTVSDFDTVSTLYADASSATFGTFDWDTQFSYAQAAGWTAEASASDYRASLLSKTGSEAGAMQAAAAQAQAMKGEIGYYAKQAEINGLTL